MNPFVISQIRTYVPIAIGALLTWLATTLKIVIDPTSQAGLVALTVGVLSSGYYGLVHLLEQKWPKIGVLLGAAKVPVYVTSIADPSIGAAIDATEPVRHADTPDAATPPTA